MTKKSKAKMSPRDSVQKSINRINDLCEYTPESDIKEYNEYLTSRNPNAPKSEYYEWLVGEIYKEASEMDVDFKQLDGEIDDLKEELETAEERVTELEFDPDISIIPSNPYDDQKIEIVKRLMNNFTLWELEGIEKELKNKVVNYNDFL